MNEMEQPLSPYVNGNPVDGRKDTYPTAVPPAAIPIINEDDGPMVVQSAPVRVTAADVDETAVANLTRTQVMDIADQIADALTDPDTIVTPPDDPEFDTLHALTRFLVGIAIEGSKEMSLRLQLWEAFLHEELPKTPPDSAEVAEKDVLRFALIGFLLESEDASRTLGSKLLKVPGGLARTAVRTAKPVTNSRFAKPLQRRIDRLAGRGEEQLTRWIQRGQSEEPFSRNLARLGVQEIVDEFINQLAQNKEVQTLVQEQGVGLAGEVVDQVRERTFTADTLIERIARAVTRRSPRVAPPMADLSEYPKKLSSG
ncbi:MAG: hypothetical protein WBO48_18260 [Candidatus Promineifilaceae bacterium]